ncbi:MAG: hypothetical protein LIO77_02800 [Rikenellaceae bacterium]|nr:hypothetical protein [Rikenellaceae bacterium]
MKYCIITVLTSFLYMQALSQDLKSQALEEFKAEHYTEAIALMQKAAVETPEDPQIWYYLGFFTHYNAYDSRPVTGYDFSYSEKVYEYLLKALELDPDYGDAKYFYGAECSANAFISMYERDADKLKYFYKKAYDIGAYPEWLREFGRNTLDGCQQDAIFFTGGNATFDVCSYLQLHENYRTDITIVSIGYLDRPWYVKFLREGLDGAVKPIKVKLSDYLIYEMHPYKWKPTAIDIPVNASQIDRYGLSEDYRFRILLDPDLVSERMHSKIDSEEVTQRTYLSANRAVLMHIIEQNYACRPIYFSNIADRFFYRELQLHVMDCGMVSQLMPFPVEGTQYERNKEKLERLIKDNALAHFPSIYEYRIPRINDPIVYSYYSALAALKSIYTAEGNASGLKKLESSISRITMAFME